MARGGLVARGVVYLLLGYLTLLIVTGSGSHATASSQGAFDEIAHQPAGPVLVVVLGIGLAAYAAWRLLQAVAGNVHESGTQELAQRIGWGVVAIVYLALAISAFEVSGGHSSGSNQASSVSSTLLRHHGGQYVLAALGFGIVLGGCWLAVWAALQRFSPNLMTRKVPQWVSGSLRAAETFGNVTRGLAFAGVGATFITAAVVDDSHDARGLNGALKALAAHPGGRYLLLVVAMGFLAFSAASMTEAWLRDVDRNVAERR